MKTIPGMTDRQKVVWDVIRDFNDTQEALATLREIRVRCKDIPSCVISDRLFALFNRGFIERHGDAYKAMPAPHEAVVESICTTCGISLRTIREGSKSLRASRARRMITKALRAKHYMSGDIAALLNLNRNTVYYYNDPVKRAIRNQRRALSKRSATLQAQIGA